MLSSFLDGRITIFAQFHKSMRVSQIMLAKNFGGAERSFVDTALALAERGHQVQAICHKQFSKIGLLQNVSGIQLETVNAGAEWDFITPRRIAAKLRAFQPEIVHTQLKRAAWHGGRAGKLAGVPVVAKLHNYVDLKKYRHIHTLFCTTEDQKKYVSNNGWPEDRVEVVPNFSRVHPTENLRNFQKSPVRILSYGRYVKKKGFDLLLHAFKSLLDSGIHAQLTIGGQGEELASLESLAKKLNIQDSVRLGQWIDDVTAALDAADLFVLPSLDEPFGIVMLEAMARGVPIISTRTKGPSEVLSEATASLVEIGSAEALANAMKDCAQNPDQALERADKALKCYRQNYYQDAVLPKIESVYKRVANRS
jgi:glycosyltransferase involved in cell wall biosynthesis